MDRGNGRVYAGKKMKRYLLAVLIFAGCVSIAPQPKTNGWTQTYGKNVALKFYGETGFTFDFGEPHYITKESKSLTIGQTITAVYQVSGSGFATVQKNTGSPAFRLMIQRGNDMTSQLGRYWSSDYVILSSPLNAENIGGNRPIVSPLPAQTFTVAMQTISATKTFSVKIDPDKWTDVYGGKGIEHLDEFKKTLAECGHVGITFGGTTGGYGHGVSGKGTFTLVDWSIK